MNAVILKNPRRCDVSEPEQCRQFAYVGVEGNENHPDGVMAMCQTHVIGIKAVYEERSSYNTERLDCEECQATGKCSACNSLAVRIADKACTRCDNSGKCPDCEGKGWDYATITPLKPVKPVTASYAVIEEQHQRQIKRFDVSGFVDEESASITISDMSIRRHMPDGDDEWGRVYVALDDLDELVMSLLYVRRELLAKWEEAKANITVEA